jgi:hypothetical protein
MTVESSTFLLIVLPAAVNGGEKKMESNAYKRRCSSNRKDSPLFLLLPHFWRNTYFSIFRVFRFSLVERAERDEKEEGVGGEWRVAMADLLGNPRGTLGNG